MRENIKIKKGKYDQIILDILRGEGPLASSKLRKLSLSKEIPYPTYNRRIKKLEEYGLIERVDLIKIAEKIQEANPEVIQDCLNVIRDQKESEEVIQDRIKQIRMESARKRVAHLPNVLSTLEGCIKNPKVADNLKALEELTFTLSNILHFERRYRLFASKKIVEKVTGSILEKIIAIVDRRPDFLQIRTILFLGDSWRREAVDLFFKKITEHELDENQISNVTYVFKELHQKHPRLIDQGLDSLLRSDDDQLKKTARVLRESIYRI